MYATYRTRDLAFNEQMIFKIMYNSLTTQISCIHTYIVKTAASANLFNNKGFMDTPVLRPPS